MINKHCPKCNQDLPKSSFTSTQAKYCIACKRIDQLEKRNEMLKRSMDRKLSKKPKKTVVVPLPTLKKQAQIVFNRWIRLRDKDLPCISCGKFKDNYDAGHYIAQGSSSFLRYHPDNVHKQCSPGCNRYMSGNLIEYRINLVKKIGAMQVEWLELHRHDIKKWEREELEEIIATYKEKIKCIP